MQTGKKMNRITLFSFIIISFAMCNNQNPQHLEAKENKAAPVNIGNIKVHISKEGRPSKQQPHIPAFITFFGSTNFYATIRNENKIIFSDSIFIDQSLGISEHIEILEMDQDLTLSEGHPENGIKIAYIRGYKFIRAHRISSKEWKIVYSNENIELE